MRDWCPPLHLALNPTLLGGVCSAAALSGMCLVSSCRPNDGSPPGGMLGVLIERQENIRIHARATMTTHGELGARYLTAAADPPGGASIEGLFTSELDARGFSAAFTRAARSAGEATPSAANPKELMSKSSQSQVVRIKLVAKISRINSIGLRFSLK